MKNKEKLMKNSTLKCKDCGKSYVFKNIGYKKEIFKEFPDCNCSEKQFKKQRAKKNGLWKIKEIRSLKSSIGKKFWGKTFSNYNRSNNPQAYKECYDYVKDFKNNIENGKGLFLSGTVGTGKTHLMAAMIDYLARIKKEHVSYYNSVSLLNKIRFTFNQKYKDEPTTEEITDEIKGCTLLMIDDLGSEKITDWASEIFFDIIDYRYSNSKSIIISTNLTSLEIKEKLNERLMSRIYEMCKGIKLIGKDHRLNI